MIGADSSAGQVSTHGFQFAPGVALSRDGTDIARVTSGGAELTILSAGPGHSDIYEGDLDPLWWVGFNVLRRFAAGASATLPSLRRRTFAALCWSPLR